MFWKALLVRPYRSRWWVTVDGPWGFHSMFPLTGAKGHGNIASGRGERGGPFPLTTPLVSYRTGPLLRFTTCGTFRSICQSVSKSVSQSVCKLYGGCSPHEILPATRLNPSTHPSSLSLFLLESPKTDKRLNPNVMFSHSRLRLAGTHPPSASRPCRAQTLQESLPTLHPTIDTFGPLNSFCLLVLNSNIAFLN